MDKMEQRGRRQWLAQPPRDRCYLQLPMIDELTWRGLLYQYTEAVLPALQAGTVTGYCGFDPTAPSLHVGNLVPVMGLVHLQRAGHRPVALVGGGTGLIGDPSGKPEERALATIEVIEENARGIRQQLERFLDFSGPRGALMRNNADWLLELPAIHFMRDVGKHFTVNYMIAKDSVKTRLDGGISYTEFSYMLLQAYDYLELHRREGVTLQLGGSDQWGNITAGIELIRRTVGAEAYAVTLPLVASADGKKFGKTESGAIWLDPARTSPYQFYQYWITVDDRDVGRYLRYFTLLGADEIASLDNAVAARPEKREAQQALAVDVTTRVHGTDATSVVVDASRIIFDRKADPRQLSPAVFEMLRGEIPFAAIALTPPSDSLGSGSPRLAILDAVVAVGLATSKGEARRLLQQGGLYVNGRQLGQEEQHVSGEEAIHGSYFLLRKGAREVALVQATTHGA
jgi:tyrosyl-tRNA synthetase